MVCSKCVWNDRKNYDKLAWMTCYLEFCQTLIYYSKFDKHQGIIFLTAECKTQQVWPKVNGTSLDLYGGFICFLLENVSKLLATRNFLQDMSYLSPWNISSKIKNFDKNRKFSKLAQTWPLQKSSDPALLSSARMHFILTSTENSISSRIFVLLWTFRKMP